MTGMTEARIITAVAIMTEPTECFFATGNAHKVAEMQALADESRLALRMRAAKDAGPSWRKTWWAALRCCLRWDR